MAKVEVIVGAWLKVLAGVTTETHKDRAKICAQCPSAQHGKYLSMIKDELIEVKGMMCGECGCPLSGKVRSDDKCPLEKW